MKHTPWRMIHLGKVADQWDVDFRFSKYVSGGTLGLLAATVGAWA